MGSKGTSGRKYNREKWGWKDEDEISSELLKLDSTYQVYNKELSKLYSKSHSDKRKLSETLSMKLIFISCILIMVMVFILSLT
jgi:hypothetical protein